MRNAFHMRQCVLLVDCAVGVRAPTTSARFATDVPASGPCCTAERWRTRPSCPSRGRRNYGTGAPRSVAATRSERRRHAERADVGGSRQETGESTQGHVMTDNGTQNIIRSIKTTLDHEAKLTRIFLKSTGFRMMS